MSKSSRDKPTAEQKRQAARKRLGGLGAPKDGSEWSEYGQPLGATLFSAGRGTSRSVGRSRTHTLGPIRITAELANQLADYGNELGLNQSDTVRQLLREALERNHTRRKRKGKK